MSALSADRVEELRAAVTAPMRAEDVRACLAMRWPDSEYLSIPEAPDSADRGGRKLDLLVVSLWRSRGLQLDGVEIKVSVSDWTRELKQAAKADFWWRHAHRFWLAVPATIVEKVRPDLPATWGLLSCAPGKAPKVAVRPEHREADPLGWNACVGLLRAAADAGVQALHRASRKGYEEGHRAATEAAARRSPDQAAAEALGRLTEQVRKFEQASGLQIEHGYGVEDLGRLVALIRKERADPGALRGSWEARNAMSAAKRLAEMAGETEVALERLTALCAAPAAERAS